MFEDMLIRDRESAFEWYRHGEPVLYAIGDAASVCEELAQAVLDVLTERHDDFESAQMGEESEFGKDSHYEAKGVDDGVIAAEWRDLERSLKVEARYINPAAEALMERLFADVDGQVTRDGAPVIVTAGPDREIKSLFRARVFHHHDEMDEALLRPDIHLGPPPAARARAGRMNAHGIAAFYGASDPEVALAEVRPPVGSRAVVGEFELLRDLRLLDVTALQSLYVEGSVFDPAHQRRLELAKFMARLSDRITMPVMPDDEPTEYLITQMIAAYLARRSAPGLDGILFRSVQQPGEQRNVVLFQHASRVEALEIPEGAELSVHQFSTSDDGPEPDYTVFEEVPSGPGGGVRVPDDLGLGEWMRLRPHEFRSDPDADPRVPHLRVRKDGLRVRHVKGVTFDTDVFEVSRHRLEKRDAER
jgi:RES domain-containing protein